MAVDDENSTGTRTFVALRWFRQLSAPIKTIVTILTLVTPLLALNKILHVVDLPGAEDQVIDSADVEATAPRYLPPDGLITYGASNAIDGQPDTAWIEGARGIGVGQWIEFTFPERVRLSRIVVRNGYAKSSDIFLTNNRIKAVEMRTDTGRHDIVFKDEQRPRSFGVPAGMSETRHLRLTIRSAYPGVGATSNRRHTALSEVVFYRRD